MRGYGAGYPEEQRNYPITSLGSVARVFGGHYVPYLCWDAAFRCIDFGWWGNRRYSGCPFLGVRKLSSAA